MEYSIPVVNAHLLEVDGFGSPMALRHRQALGHLVDGDHPPGTQHPRALDGELAPTGPHPQMATVSPGSISAYSAAM
jgi:hypothetical protein